jgi:hypothetical protein
VTTSAFLGDCDLEVVPGIGLVKRSGLDAASAALMFGLVGVDQIDARTRPVIRRTVVLAKGCGLLLEGSEGLEHDFGLRHGPEPFRNRPLSAFHSCLGGRGQRFARLERVTRIGCKVAHQGILLHCRKAAAADLTRFGIDLRHLGETRLVNFLPGLVE